MLVNVPASKLKVNSCNGCKRRDAGLEVGPNLANWGSTGCPTSNSLIASTTNVTFVLVEPLLSAATNSKLAAPTSSGPGVPENFLVPLMSCNQVGWSESRYVRGLSVEVKVDSEKTNIYGSDTRATGGTCAFTGNSRAGFAAAHGSCNTVYASRAAMTRW